MKALIMILSFMSISTFASELCGSTQTLKNRFYIEGYSTGKIEVLIPAHAGNELKSHFKNNHDHGCLAGKLVKVGSKQVFVAVRLNPDF